MAHQKDIDDKVESKKEEIETMSTATFKSSEGNEIKVAGVSMEHLTAMFNQHQHYTNCCTLR